MAIGVQVTFDAGDCDRLARFWATALDYVIQPPPEGFGSWDEALEAWGVPADQRDTASAVVDPDGHGPRIFFQKVPETKSGKNRVHLDINAAVGRTDPDERRRLVDERVARCVDAGATVLREAEERGERWVVLSDPEGNEFCVQ